MSRSSVTQAVERAGFDMITFSVISSDSTELGAPRVFRTSLTRPGKSGSCRLRGETLTDTLSGGAPGARQSCSDRSRTNMVSWLTSPVCSASSMKSTGSRRPYSGWCHRTSASTLATTPLRNWRIG